MDPRPIDQTADVGEIGCIVRRWASAEVDSEQIALAQVLARGKSAWYL